MTNGIGWCLLGMLLAFFFVWFPIGEKTTVTEEGDADGLKKVSMRIENVTLWTMTRDWWRRR